MASWTMDHGGGPAERLTIYIYIYICAYARPPPPLDPPSVDLGSGGSTHSFLRMFWILTTDTSKIQAFPRVFDGFYPRINEQWKSTKYEK